MANLLETSDDAEVRSSSRYKLSPTEKHGYQLTDEKGTKLLDGISYFSIEHAVGQFPQVNLIFSAPIDLEMPSV